MTYDAEKALREIAEALDMVDGDQGRYIYASIAEMITEIKSLHKRAEDAYAAGRAAGLEEAAVLMRGVGDVSAERAIRALARDGGKRG